MTTLKAGDKAPDFKSTNQDGNTVNLSDFTGKKLVLIFLPKGQYTWMYFGSL
jgi:peroxiredoxin Q/BCP